MLVASRVAMGESEQEGQGDAHVGCCRVYSSYAIY